MATFRSAKWQGGFEDGKGAISTKSGALKDYPYGFAHRFEGKHLRSLLQHLRPFTARLGSRR
jgi:hypothetical protein